MPPTFHIFVPPHSQERNFCKYHLHLNKSHNPDINGNYTDDDEMYSGSEGVIPQASGTLVQLVQPELYIDGNSFNEECTSP